MLNFLRLNREDGLGRHSDHVPIPKSECILMRTSMYSDVYGGCTQKRMKSVLKPANTLFGTSIALSWTRFDGYPFKEKSDGKQNTCLAVVFIWLGFSFTPGPDSGEYGSSYTHSVTTESFPDRERIPDPLGARIR